MADDLEQEEKKKGREEAEQSKALDTLTDHVSTSGKEPARTWCLGCMGASTLQDSCLSYSGGKGERAC